MESDDTLTRDQLLKVVLPVCAVSAVSIILCCVHGYICRATSENSRCRVFSKIASALFWIYVVVSIVCSTGNCLKISLDFFWACLGILSVCGLIALCESLSSVDVAALSDLSREKQFYHSHMQRLRAARPAIIFTFETYQDDNGVRSSSILYQVFIIIHMCSRHSHF